MNLNHKKYEICVSADTHGHLSQRIVRHVPAGEGIALLMATVTFENATRIYPGNDRPSVDALNLEIADGEFLVLVGPSGCGKSTSLRMLAGLEDVNAGRILIGDRDVTDVQPKDRDIAMVFQNYALYPHMSVRENMGFALKIAGTPKAEIDKRVREAAELHNFLLENYYHAPRIDVARMLDELQAQAEQIRRYREAWKEAGHDWTPRVSVSRSIFPIVSEVDRKFFALRGEDSHDQIGVIDGLQSTFGRTYAAEPDVLIEQLARDEALHAADTLMLTIPSQLGVDFNLHILQAFAEHVAPALGWQPNTAGPVTGYSLEV